MEQANPLPNTTAPSRAVTTLPTNPPSSKKPVLIIFLVVFVIVLISLNAYLFMKLQNPSPAPIKSPAPVVQASPTPLDVTANWKTYTNSKYGYLIKLPNEYKTETYYVVSGDFTDTGADAQRVGVYLNKKNPFDNFFEIQANTVTNKSLIDLIQVNYKENTTHFQTTKFSSIKTSKLDDNPSYEYTYDGEALVTNGWSAVVTKGEYKVIFTQKSNVIYAVYLTNSNPLNQILSTFKFLE